MRDKYFLYILNLFVFFVGHITSKAFARVARKYPLWITACTACNYIVYIMYMQTKDVNIRIDRKTYKKLKIGAAHEGITLKELVDSLCDFL